MAKKQKAEVDYLIYIHISPSNKCYVGKTCQHYKERWGLNGSNYIKKRNGKFIHPKFANAILKYGWNNFKHEILFENLSKEEADQIEINLIAKYKVLNLSYNISIGGEGGREKGFKHSKETKQKISNSLKNRTLSKEHKNNISESLKNKKFTEEHKQKISNSMKGKHSKKVKMLSKNGEYIRSFDSLTDAAKFINKTPGHISKCCLGIRNTAYGFKWEYEKNN